MKVQVAGVPSDLVVDAAQDDDSVEADAAKGRSRRPILPVEIPQ